MNRQFTRSRIGISVGLVLVSMMALLSSGAMAPARPLAAAAVATPDCSGVEAYRQQLGAIQDDYRAAFLERLPGVTPDWEITGGVDFLEAAFIDPGADYGLLWTNWLMGRSEAQFSILAELWAERANQLRALPPPPVAQALHEGLISATEFFADLYQLAAKEGAMMAMFAIMLSGNDGPPSLAELNDALVASCPAWAAYGAETVATPIPS
jgi:hypothetical protein